MKKLLGLFVIMVLIGVILVAGCGPTPPPHNNPTPSPTPDPPPVLGRNIVHFDGDSYEGMGANTFAECLVYFNTTKLQSYIGCELQGVQIFYSDFSGNPETFPYTVKVYNGVGGTATSPGTLLYSGDYTFIKGWNEVGLPTAIPITNGLVIWAGFSTICPSAWPISHDLLPAVPKTSYISTDFNPTWSAINVNLNIRLELWKD